MASEVKTNKVSPATGSTTEVTGLITSTSDARGDVLYHDGTNFTRLAKPGTPAGEVLTFATSASDPAWVAAAGGLVLLSSSASAVDAATINFQDFRDSTLYESYRIVGRMRNATNDVAWRMRFMAGASAVTASTYTGAGNGYTVWSGSAAVFNWGNWNADTFNLFENTGGGAGTGIDSDVAQLFDFTVHLQHSGSISSFCQITGTMSFWGHTDAQYGAVYGGTYATSATDITGVQFYYASGDVTEHDIDVYGMVKS